MAELRVIAGGADERPVWHQKRGEEEAEFLLFLGWLHSEKPRKPPEFPAIALQNGWTDRADAYDLAHELPSTPTGRAARGWHDLEEIFSVEARKLAKDVKANPHERTLSVKEVLTLGAILVDNQEAVKRLLDAENSDTGEELRNLSDEELRAIQLAKKAIGNIGKGKR